MTKNPPTQRYGRSTMKNKMSRPIQPFVLGLLLMIGSAWSHEHKTKVTDSLTPMIQAANEVLASLPPELQQQATLPFDSNERFNWTYVPKKRQGLVLKHMDDTQRAKTHALLRTALSTAGYQKATNIIALESVLRVMEGAEHRDPELYYLSLFGTPAEHGHWGWRFEGHHLSLNFTMVDGKLLATAPNFWGANPAKIPIGEKKGFRTLAKEEDLARALFRSLSKQQKSVTRVNQQAYKEILTKTKATVTALEPLGILYKDLSTAQQRLLMSLLDEYITNMPADIAKKRKDAILASDLEHLAFAWAGSEHISQKHYYRIQGQSFLVEYDNFQTNANHIHTVWRDFEGDFGRNLLAEHYQKHAH
jgi:Protein of unknown function (DUF3500)